MEQNPSNHAMKLDHGNRHNDSLQEDSKITAGHSTSQNSQIKGTNDNSKMQINDRSQFIFENSVIQEDRSIDHPK